MKKQKNLFIRIKKLLQEPFPEESSVSDTFKIAAFVGIFIFLFLYLLQPFNLHNAGSDALLYAFYFGLVTFTITVLYDFIQIYILKVKSNHPSWTFGRWIISTIGLVMCIGIANYILTLFINEINHFSWSVLLNTIYSTFLLGIFPVVFLGAIKLSNRNKEYQEIAKSIAPKMKIIDEPESITIDNNGETINIPTDKFIYAESSKNYVMIFFWEASIQNVLIRSTLTALSDQILHKDIVRCHRSFLVNKQNIDEVAGNAQGLKLKMKNTQTIVPVSRKYIPLFK